VNPCETSTERDTAEEQARSDGRPARCGMSHNATRRGHVTSPLCPPLGHRQGAEPPGRPTAGIVPERSILAYRGVRTGSIPPRRAVRADDRPSLAPGRKAHS